MIQIALCKEVDLTQLSAELTKFTGIPSIGLRRVWDGKVGHLTCLTAGIGPGALRYVADAHTPKKGKDLQQFVTGGTSSSTRRSRRRRLLRILTLGRVR